MLDQHNSELSEPRDRSELSELCDRIKHGEYLVDPHAVADAMIRRFRLDLAQPGDVRPRERSDGRVDERVSRGSRRDPADSLTVLAA